MKYFFLFCIYPKIIALLKVPKTKFLKLVKLYKTKLTIVTTSTGFGDVRWVKCKVALIKSGMINAVCIIFYQKAWEKTIRCRLCSCTNASYFLIFILVYKQQFKFHFVTVLDSNLKSVYTVLQILCNIDARTLFFQLQHLSGTLSKI